MTKKPFVVGVISDTHGLLRPEVVAAFAGVKAIIHCGDVGSAEVLAGLLRIAPVHAVRGNNDLGAWAKDLPVHAVVELGRHSLYVIHDRSEIHLEPAAAGFSAVLAGHSHRPGIEEQEGVLFVNPGSAGPRRFKLPAAVARLVLGKGRCEAEIVELAGR